MDVKQSTNNSKTTNEFPNELYSYQLSLFSEDEIINTILLPNTNEGVFYVSDDLKYRFLSIVAHKGNWIVLCKKPAFLPNQGYECTIQDHQLLEIEYEQKTFYLYSEKLSCDTRVFHRYYVDMDTEICIGKQVGCHISCNNPLISNKHVALFRYATHWYITDCGSTFGIYVNGLKKRDTHLYLGDVVTIPGLRIIIGVDFIAISHSDDVMIGGPGLTKLSNNPKGYSGYYGQHDYATTFTPFPRKRMLVDKKIITIESPPMSMNQSQLPLPLRMGSSMVMGGSAALSGNYTMLLSTLLFPLLRSGYSEKERKQYEQLRQTKYTEYLAEKRREIECACTYEQSVLEQKYPAAKEVISRAKTKRRLWERRPGDDDFLCVRMGAGKQPMQAEIHYPEKHFTLETDDLTEKMYQLVERQYVLENCPIILSLIETSVCGIAGHHRQVIEYLRQWILQLATFHSYDEVKMVFLLSEDDLDMLDFVRYLPHVWDNYHSIRFLATNEAEAYALGEYLNNQLQDEETGNQKKHSTRPHFLIFALNKKLVESHQIMKDILQAEAYQGVSFIAAYNDFPKEAQKIITLNTEQQSVCTTLVANGGEDQLFDLDSFDLAEAQEAMRIIANTKLKITEQSHSLPSAITFLEMYRVGRIEQLNPLKRWQESNPTYSLAAPVGVSGDGSLFMLDLHEKRQGPHGLVAGMTGSGKSEFIITYILSMAINYHPDEVAFLLIDYKGGGLAGAFENPQTGVRLPHLVGTITNLDGASIQRSLMSIESELLRRQRVFQDIKSTVNEGTMDIYSYQKLYRAGKVEQPMPHLFIVSDEFAELKQQQPEFMDRLISAARIGRSLGIHLILATQKPSGVVNDQIRSNTKFRVCLRVQERADSMDMLMRPEAAELTDTGRFYLQVGYNEYFAMGQSAWSGASYEPQDTVSDKRDDTIEFLDAAGQTIAKAKPEVTKTDSGMKQIVAIVKYLSDIASAHGICAKQLWRPELPTLLDLDSLQEEYQGDHSSMSVCLGKLDDPQNLDQFPLFIDFETCGNILIAGEISSGKSAIIQNILYSLSKQLTPKDFNFYALDYSSRMLNLLKPLPHCGILLQEEDIGSLDGFFKVINSIVAERKQLFSKLEVSSFSEALKHVHLPLVIVVIDNLAGLSLSKPGETHQYRLQSYLKNSALYGIKYIISCSQLSEVSSRIRKELPERICLHMRDKYDYNDVLGCKVSYCPPEKAGRGLYKIEDMVYELQNAMICAFQEDSERVQHIKSTVSALCAQYGIQSEATHLPVMELDAEYSVFAAQFQRGRIPLGFAKQSGKPVALPLKQFRTLGLYFGNPSGTKPIIQNLLFAAQREGMELWIIKRQNNSLFDVDNADGINIDALHNSFFWETEKQNLRSLQQAISGSISQRKKLIKEHRLSEVTPNAAGIYGYPEVIKIMPPIFLLIESVADFCSQLSDIAVLSYCTYFKNMHRYGIHSVVCFCPDTPEEIQRNEISSIFAQNEVLLFGGQLGKQSLHNISGIANTEDKLPYNMGLMTYRNKLYSLNMPCGKVEQTALDADMESIF